MKRILVFLILLNTIYSCKTQIPEKPISNKESISELAATKIEELGVSEGVAWLEKNKKSSDYTFNEGELNGLGYHILYELDEVQEAIKVFKIIVETFPGSSNAYDSLAESYLAGGEYDLSIANYKKAIDLGEGLRFYQVGYLDPRPYAETQLPKDTMDLFVSEGSWENEIAFVYVQGGPNTDLNINARDGLHLMPNQDNFLRVYPYQSQMLNPFYLITQPLLTDEQSANENAISVDILDRTIRYLVSRKKRVFLIGHSYGASLSIEYLHAKENLAEKVVVMGLDLDEDISSWEQVETGQYIRWENGETPIVRDIFGNISEEHPAKSSFNLFADNLTMLVKSNMQKKYTDLYSDEDFKRLISVYARYDEANGRKSQEELDLLAIKGAKVVEVEGDHHDMLTTNFMGALYNYLIEGEPLLSRY